MRANEQKSGVDGEPNTQEERLRCLLDVLEQEFPQCGQRSENLKEQRRLLRSLMNIRMPGPVSPKYLRIQDAFLKEESREKGVVTLEDIPTIKEQFGSMHRFADKLSVWQGDITRLKLDAIVNAANSRMLGCFVPCHGCIDNAIHSAAGLQLREECSRLMEKQGYPEPVGRAKITRGYNLPSRYVLHTVGPYIEGEPTREECAQLKSCYHSCLELAWERGLKSIGFCCISTGEFHFPNDLAARIAVDTVEEYLEHSKLERIVFNVFKDCDWRLYSALLGF